MPSIVLMWQGILVSGGMLMFSRSIMYISKCCRVTQTIFYNRYLHRIAARVCVMVKDGFILVLDED